MLRHALRRLLWLVPTLFFLTLGSFALLSYVPDPADDPRLAEALGPERVEELRRSRFLDLPRFFNPRPIDMRARIDALVLHLIADDEEAPRARALLLRLGGAALPHLLPQLDALDPESRTEVALALAPLADRMGIESDEPRDPERAVAFWSRFWADRESDFRPASARRAVRRLSFNATAMREADLRILDTFALGELFALITELAGTDDVPRQQRLFDIASHITHRQDTLPLDATPREARACAHRWLDWWLSNRSEYAAYDGPSRLAAIIVDTQYARWFERMLSLELGTDAQGVPILDKLRDRAPVSLAIAAIAVLVAYAIALPLGILSVLRHRKPGHGALLVSSLLSHVVPTACLAVLFAKATPQRNEILLPALLLSLAFIASPLRHQRARLIEVLRLDFIRAARARGLGPLRVLLGQALRGTLGSTITLFSLDLPMALAGSFVVEKAFGIHGLGEETIRAVETRDVAWLMTLGFSAAVLGALSLLFSDIALSLIDPRARASLLRRERALG